MALPKLFRSGRRARRSIGSIVAVALVLTGSAAGAGAQGLHGGTGGSTAGVLTLKDVAGKPIPFGSARYFGGITVAEQREGVVGIAARAAGRGYWLAAPDGAVYSYGAGQPGRSTTTARHVVAIVATPDGGGYWLACGDGAVVASPDAHLYGSASGFPLSTAITAMAAMPDGRGYWLVAGGGRVFAYGAARVYGSAAHASAKDRAVAMASAADGRGYWVALADGRVFAFGDARSFAPAADLGGASVVAMASTPDGLGYWLAASNGAVFAYGDARPYGSATSVVTENPIVAMTAAPGGQGYWLLPMTPSPSALPPPGPGFVAGHVTAIGDSVMLDAEPALVADIPGIDVEAAVSRQWYEGVDLAQQLLSEGRLGAIVVIDLGTNGPVTTQMFAQMMAVLSGASRVVFVTVHLPSSYSWSQSVNETLRQEVPLYPRARLADFNKLADEHPDWFYGDGIHMPIGGAGAQAMATLIKSAI